LQKVYKQNFEQKEPRGAKGMIGVFTKGIPTPLRKRVRSIRQNISSGKRGKKTAPKRRFAESKIATE